MGAPCPHAQRGFFVGRDYRVAANDQIRTRHAHARGANVVLVVGNQHMAPGRAAFLRESACILCDDAFAFNMRGKTEQLPNGDDACATHAVNNDAIGMLALTAEMALAKQTWRTDFALYSSWYSSLCFSSSAGHLLP